MTAPTGWARTRARCLAGHRLLTPAPAADIADVVASMSGAHAQLMSAAELSIGLRTEGTTRADVRNALWRDRTLVKTYGPRGTVHLLPAADLPLWARWLPCRRRRGATPGWTTPRPPARNGGCPGFAVPTPRRRCRSCSVATCAGTAPATPRHFARWLAAAQREAVERRVVRIGEILEAAPTLTFGPVVAGKHL